MPKVPIRFLGAGFQPKDKIVAMLEPDVPYESQLSLILPCVKMEEMTFRALKLNQVTADKQKGAPINLSDTPAMLGDSKWIWMTSAAKTAPTAPKAPPAKPAAAPPSASQDGESDGSAPTMPPPPPPPPKRPAGTTAADIPAPPPPRPPTVKTAGIPAPPPPRPVSPARAAAPVDHGDLPPPPPMPRSKSPVPADRPAVAPPPPMPKPKTVPQHTPVPVASVQHDDDGEGITITIPGAAPSVHSTPSTPSKPPPPTGTSGLRVPSGGGKAPPSRSTSPAKPNSTALNKPPDARSAVPSRNTSPVKTATLNRPPGTRSAVPSRNTSPVKAAAAEPVVTSPAAKPVTKATAAPSAAVKPPAPSEPSLHSDGAHLDTSMLIRLQEQCLELQRQLIESDKRNDAKDMERRAQEAAMRAEMEEQRLKMLQLQTASQAERQQHLQAMVARENELREKQVQMMTELQNRAATAAAGNPQLEDLRVANAELKEAYLRREQIARQQEDKASAEVLQVAKVQAQIVAAMSEFHRQTSAITDGRSDGGHASSSNALDAVDVASQDAMVRFLTSIGLGKFIPAMMQHDVDFAALRKMSEADLIGIGVNTIGARKKILLELQHLETKEHADDDPGAPGSREAKMLASTGASLSSNEFRRHERILKRFFERVEPQLVPRVETIVRQFSRQLDALYSGLAHRYEIQLSPYRPAMVAFLRREGFTFLLPAVDVILFSYANREAEFAERIVLDQLKQTQEPLTWLVFQANKDESPRRVQAPPPPSGSRRGRSRASSLVGRDGSGSATPQGHYLGDGSPNTAGGDNDNSEGSDYYYCALVDLAQWEFPRFGSRERIARVVEVPLRSTPHTGGRLLEPNPLATDVIDALSVNHRYIAAAVALLMRKDPLRLTQYDALRRQYSGSRDVEFERGATTEREDAPFNAKAMYLDLARWYTSHHDHTIGGTSSVAVA